MASSSGNSLQNSGSNSGDAIEMRKRKRMQSNRESARRSRMRKQKHLDDLSSIASQIKKENDEICARINFAWQRYLDVESENSVLRARMIELGQRLDSLNEILGFVDADFGSGYRFDRGSIGNNDLNCVYLNQPIMASPDLFRY